MIEDVQKIASEQRFAAGNAKIYNAAVHKLIDQIQSLLCIQFVRRAPCGVRPVL